MARRLRAEMDRAQKFTGKEMDTTAVHGDHQRFQIDALRLTLSSEVDKEYQKINAIKGRIVWGIHRISELEKYIEVKEDRLRDRNAALVAFEKEAVKQEGAVKVLSRMMNMDLSITFDRWRAGVREVQREKTLMKTTIRKLTNSFVFSAWLRWRWAIDQMRDLEEAGEQAKRDHNMPGMGSVLLEKVGWGVWGWVWLVCVWLCVVVVVLCVVVVCVWLL